MGARLCTSDPKVAWVGGRGGAPGGEDGQSKRVAGSSDNELPCGTALRRGVQPI